MTSHHKESHGLLIYAMIFFICLTISALALLVQLQESSQTTAEFFEPLQIDLTNPLF